MQWRKDICSGPARCTAGQITPIYPDLPRADPSQILPGGTWVCYMCLHVDSIFNKVIVMKHKEQEKTWKHEIIYFDEIEHELIKRIVLSLRNTL